MAPLRTTKLEKVTCFEAYACNAQKTTSYIIQEYPETPERLMHVLK